MGVYYHVCCKLAALLYSRPPVATPFILRFYRHSLFGRPSGGHIFLCVKKDMEERHAKGLQSRPLESGFLYGGLEGRRADFSTCAPGCNLRDLGPPGGVPVVFALRGFAGKPSTTFFRQFHCRKHCFRRTLLYCSNCGEFVGTLRITSLICGRKLGCRVSLSIFLGTAARRGKGISGAPQPT